ncbi:hypothetical protein LCGC14_0979100 [marine sediment metagenome]|uniref:Nuclease associated modular domain-containing protein n=1 Tax=marine sediment metagenome TaxID=412755 RepID=A0A0F9N9A2_9ZZZZ
MVKGHGPKGYKQSPEHIEKRRQAMMRYYKDPEWQRWRGETVSRGTTPAQRERIRRLNLGKPVSEEMRGKLRRAALQQWERDGDTLREGIRRVHKGNKYRLGKGHSPETREKIRQARLRQSPQPKKATGIELRLEHEFRKRRLKFEMHKTMFGRFQPDFVFESVKLIVQADGDYWHRQRPGQLEKDARFNEMAASDGWTVWRFAETEITQHSEACGRAVARFVRSH